jgi:hypothetical protein
MHQKRSRFEPGVSFVNETLECRVVMSTSGLQGTAEVAASVLRNSPTMTSVAVSAGTLGQPITFTVTVRAPAAAGAPQGTVNITDHGQVLQTLTLSPTASTNTKYAYSQATYTLIPQPGGGAPYFGRHAINATFTPNGAFSRSAAGKVFNVSQPQYTALANGVKVATIAQGSGPQIQSGQTANLLYAGYLAKNGQIFDNSLSHGGTPLAFTLGAGQVIPGFDAGTVGMQVGESRVISIPPSQGYGSTANGPIPANSTLIFVVTLTSIS